MRRNAESGMRCRGKPTLECQAEPQPAHAVEPIEPEKMAPGAEVNRARPLGQRVDAVVIHDRSPDSESQAGARSEDGPAARQPHSIARPGGLTFRLQFDQLGSSIVVQRQHSFIRIDPPDISLQLEPS